MSSIVTNCPLCEEKGLHIHGEGESDTRQCINCGYATNNTLKGVKEENNKFNQFSEFIKKHSKEASEHIWFPTMINLPIGSLYPIEEGEILKWAYVKMIDIPESEQKNYPDETNPGDFLTKTLDYENQEIFDEYIFGLAKIRDEANLANG